MFINLCAIALLFVSIKSLFVSIKEVFWVDFDLSDDNLDLYTNIKERKPMSIISINKINIRCNLMLDFHGVAIGLEYK